MIGHNNLNTKNTYVDFISAENYVKWLDFVLSGEKEQTYMLNLHYCYEGKEYSQVAYYSEPSFKELYFYTPDSFSFIGVSHDINDTYLLLYGLIHKGR